MSVASILCDRCGSSNLKKINDSVFKCEHCGALSIAKKGQDANEKTIDETIIELVKADKRLNAIPYVNDNFHTGLNEAVKYVDEVCALNNINNAGVAIENKPFESTGKELDDEVIGFIQTKSYLHAVKHYQAQMAVNTEEAKAYVSKLCESRNITVKKGKCYIATACVGSYEAPEVMALRCYRDFVLMNSLYGRLLIKVYYLISPFFAFIISKNLILRKLSHRYIVVPAVKIAVKRNLGLL